MIPTLPEAWRARRRSVASCSRPAVHRRCRGSNARADCPAHRIPVAKSCARQAHSDCTAQRLQVGLGAPPTDQGHRSAALLPDAYKMAGVMAWGKAGAAAAGEAASSLKTTIATNITRATQPAQPETLPMSIIRQVDEATTLTWKQVSWPGRPAHATLSSCALPAAGRRSPLAWRSIPPPPRTPHRAPPTRRLRSVPLVSASA